MDGLDAFETALQAEKTGRAPRERDHGERKRRKHHHHDQDERDEAHHRHRSRRHREDEKDDRHRYKSHPDGDVKVHGRRHRPRQYDDDDDGDEEGHRQKRSRQSKDDSDRKWKEHRSSTDQSSRKHGSSKREGEVHEVEEESPTTKGLTRDSWMTAPSALDIDYVNRRNNRSQPPPPKKDPERALHARELNRALLDRKDEASLAADIKEIAVDYAFGDEGSRWRMMKLKAVYTTAESDGRPVEDVALERFGSLQEFDIAREEQEEVDRRKLYGNGYQGKEKPTGDLYMARLGKMKSTANTQAVERHSPTTQPTTTPSVPADPRVDATALNRLRAKMLKAQLRGDPDAAKIEEEYNQAMAVAADDGPETIALGAMENRMLVGSRGEIKAIETKRGRERGNVEENDDMTIQQMLQEERRTRGQTGGEGMRFAERIAKDSKFGADLEYMDDNAEKLARRVHKSEVNLKNLAVNEYKKVQKALDNCPLCYQEDTGKQPIAPVISLGTRVFLTLPTEPEVSDGGAVIVPLSHRTNLLDCDDDEWEEIRNFMKSLTRMYHDQGREVIFYENAATPHRHPHAAMVVTPIPYEEGGTIPAFFKEAFLTADEEWSQHRKIIDTGAKAKEGMGRAAFRRCIAKEMPYFHVWFTLDGGLGHVIENSDKWPRGDLFAREVIGGVLDVGPEVIKRQGRWRKGDGRVDGFQKRWRKFDWTRVLEG